MKKILFISNLIINLNNIFFIQYFSIIPLNVFFVVNTNFNFSFWIWYIFQWLMELICFSIALIHFFPEVRFFESVYRIFFKSWLAGICMHTLYSSILYVFFITNWSEFLYYNILFVMCSSFTYIVLSIIYFFFPLLFGRIDFNYKADFFLSNNLPTKELILREDDQLFIKKVKKSKTVFIIKIFLIFMLIFPLFIIMTILFGVIIGMVFG